jgi:tetrahydromethanopterin S-methyltransferase subunit F
MKMTYKEQLIASRNFATTIGVLIVVAIFGLAIGTVMFIQSGESLRDITLLRWL